MTSFYAHPTAVIDEDCFIGEGTKIWHFSHIMPHATIGKNCMLGQNVMIASEVIIGNGVKIQNNVSVFTGVICEDEVFLAPSVVFTNVMNPRSAISKKSEYKTTLLKKGATIGANVTVICGITIGRYAFVGAGSVVTKDIPDYALVMGNPARQKGWMSETGAKLIFNNDNMAICAESGAKYKLENGLATKI
jgi:UDP-2-acetamido-3-amino-2,3-dideoxy-glucuronate N-acetyltransferase